MSISRTAPPIMKASKPASSKIVSKRIACSIHPPSLLFIFLLYYKYDNEKRFTWSCKTVLILPKLCEPIYYIVVYTSFYKERTFSAIAKPVSVTANPPSLVSRRAAGIARPILFMASITSSGGI